MTSLGYHVFTSEAPFLPLTYAAPALPEAVPDALVERLAALPQNSLRVYNRHVYLKHSDIPGAGRANWGYYATLGSAKAEVALRGEAPSDPKGLAPSVKVHTAVSLGALFPVAANLAAKKVITLPPSQAKGHALAASYPSFGPGPHREAARKALALMSSLHGTGGQKLPRPGKLVFEAGTAKTTSSGNYQHTDGAAEYIAVRPWATHPMLTFAHESAHFFDHQGLGGAPGMFGSEGSQAPEWQALRGALDATASVKSLRGLQASRVKKGKAPSKYVDYLLRNREVFARAYAQWFALRSGDAEAQKELDSIRPLGHTEATDVTKKFLYGQWSDEDFAPVAAAMDSFFQAKGWMK